MTIHHFYLMILEGSDSRRTIHRTINGLILLDNGQLDNHKG